MVDSMVTFVFPLADLNATLDKVGGKGQSLSRLAQAGLPVPGGFHVTTEAYCHFVAENGIWRQIQDLLGGDDPLNPVETTRLEKISEQIRNLFYLGVISLEMAEAITVAYLDLTGRNSTVAVAVRSSATAEDLPGASFAGQHETYLNIHGREAVLDAVKACWASLWTARALAYRARHGIAQETVALAVTVQEMVNADSAGVLFTANPVDGSCDQIVINAAWGLGEAVVSGAVTPDTLTVDKKNGQVLHHDVAEKQVMTVLTESGTVEVAVPAAKRKTAVLTNAQVSELARVGVEIEKLYGRPMDIEWALAGGRFAILQARPITFLPEPLQKWVLSKPKTIAQRTSFVEFVPDVVPPLFSSLALPIASQATMKFIAEVLGIQKVSGYYFEVINGYVYGCFDTRSIFHYSVRGIPGMAKIFRYGKRRREEVQLNSKAAAEKWRAVDLVMLSAVELLAGVRELFTVTADYFTVAQSGPIPLSTTSEIFFRSFYNALVKRKSDPAAEIFLLGIENVPLRAEKSLFELAQWAQQQAGLAEYLHQTPASTVWENLQANPVPAPLAGEFFTRFSAHLAAFGHVIYDLDFSKPVPADDPLPILETLKIYLAGQGHNPLTRFEIQAEHRLRAQETISKRLDPIRKKWFLKLLKSAQDTAPDRENAIADLGLPYPQIRRILRELGQRLVKGGALNHPQDIYWLEVEEVEMLANKLDHNERLTSLSPTVTFRQASLHAARLAVPPPVLPENSWLAALLKGKKSSGNSLKGYGASAGQITARACVLRGPEDFAQMQPGDVIVAVTTTPAWTPLFAIASAVVTDIGGPLSHCSIVAREYGIPAVMATGRATRRIHTGQIITVDGNSGTVQMIDYSDRSRKYDI
jgi:rifampicin phosphotransferase